MFRMSEVPLYSAPRWRCPEDGGKQRFAIHPGANPGANLKSISHRCHPILVAFVWELTKETIHLPLGCLQGGLVFEETRVIEESVFLWL